MLLRVAFASLVAATIWFMLIDWARGQTPTPNTFFAARASAAQSMAGDVAYDVAHVEASVLALEKVFPGCIPMHNHPWCELVLDAAPFRNNAVTQSIAATQFGVEMLMATRGQTPCWSYGRAMRRACTLVGKTASHCPRASVYEKACLARAPPPVSRTELARLRIWLHMLPSLPRSGLMATPNGQ